MSFLKYAVYGYARRLMSRRELAEAQSLAAKADAGDEAATKALDAIVEGLIRDPGRKRRNGKGRRQW